MTRYSLLFFCCGCLHAGPQKEFTSPSISLPAIVGDIETPKGYNKISITESSFGAWLRDVHIKQDKRVYLYNGVLKRNQSAQYAVLDISVGDKDLQQCADAIMRLRAEYWLHRKMPDSIAFTSTSGQLLSYAAWRKGTRWKLSGNKLVSFQQAINRGEEDKDFKAYLDLVFTYCGTLSLHRELKPVVDINKIEPGDVWIKPGSPGHAMLVMDVVVNSKGEKKFMLAQSYMPAQDIHIVLNPMEANSPWYSVTPGRTLITPEWEFSADQLRRWQK